MGAALSYCTLLHSVKAVQTVSALVVAAVAWKWVDPSHLVIAEHILLDCAVGAVVWYVFPNTHSVTLLHTRSDVVVGAVLWNSVCTFPSVPSAQIVRAKQFRSPSAV